MWWRCTSTLPAQRSAPGVGAGFKAVQRMAALPELSTLSHGAPTRPAAGVRQRAERRVCGVAQWRKLFDCYVFIAASALVKR